MMRGKGTQSVAKPLSHVEIEQMKRFQHQVELNPSGDGEDIWLGMYAHDVPRLLATIDELRQLCHPIVGRAVQQYCTSVQADAEEYEACMELLKTLRQCSNVRSESLDFAPFVSGKSP